MLLAAHRAADDQAPQRGEEEQVDHRLALGGDAGGLDPLAQLDPRQRPLLGQRPLDCPHRTLGLGLADALLAQPPHARGEQRRRGQRLQPRVVLAAHQVQRAAVEPGDDQRALLAQRPLDVGGAQPFGARPHRQPEAARVLALHCEQPLGDRGRIAQRRPGERLRREALSDDGPAI